MMILEGGSTNKPPSRIINVCTVYVYLWSRDRDKI